MSLKSLWEGVSSIGKGGVTGLASSPSTASSNSVMSIVNGEKYEQTTSSIVLLGFNSGWVSTCNGKNAATCASIPIKLYYHNKQGRDLEITANRVLDPFKTKAIAESKGINLKRDEFINEITDHPILDLFQSVNDTMNYYDWCELMFSYQGLIGNGYTEIVRGEDGLPIALLPLLGEYVVPIATGRNQGDILYYIYKPDMGGRITGAPEERKIEAKNMLHFAQYAPGNTLLGRGDLENCLSAQERYCYYDAFEKYLGVNNSRPDFIAAYKGKLNEKDLKDMYRQWNKRFGGVRNSGKVAVTSGDLEIKTLSMSPKELQYQVGRQWALKEICGAFGVPEALVSTTNVNRANAVESQNHYLRNTIYPKMVKYCSKLNESLIPSYDENLFCWFEEQYLENANEKVQSTINAYTQGILTKNEARSAMGYEKVAEEGADSTAVVAPEPAPAVEPQPITPVSNSNVNSEVVGGTE